MSDISTLTLAKLYESQNQILDAFLVYEKLYRKSPDEDLNEKIIDLRKKIFSGNNDSYDHLINNLFSDEEKAEFKILPHSQFQLRAEENTAISNEETFPEDLMSVNEVKENTDIPQTNSSDFAVEPELTSQSEELPEVVTEQAEVNTPAISEVVEITEEPTKELSEDDISDEEARRLAEEIAIEIGEFLPEDTEQSNTENEEIINTISVETDEKEESPEPEKIKEILPEFEADTEPAPTIEQETKTEEPVIPKTDEPEETSYNNIETSHESFNQDLIDEIENIDNTINNEIENILNSEEEEDKLTIDKEAITGIETKWLQKRIQKESGEFTEAKNKEEIPAEEIIQTEPNIATTEEVSAVKSLSEIIQAITNNNKLGIEIFLSEHFKSKTKQDEIQLSEIVEAIRIYKQLNEEQDQ